MIATFAHATKCDIPYCICCYNFDSKEFDSKMEGEAVHELPQCSFSKCIKYFFLVGV